MDHSRRLPGRRYTIHHDGRRRELGLRVLFHPRQSMNATSGPIRGLSHSRRAQRAISGIGAGRPASCRATDAISPHPCLGGMLCARAPLSPVHPYGDYADQRPPTLRSAGGGSIVIRPSEGRSYSYDSWDCNPPDSYPVRLLKAGDDPGAPSRLGRIPAWGSPC